MCILQVLEVSSIHWKVLFDGRWVFLMILEFFTTNSALKTCLIGYENEETKSSIIRISLSSQSLSSCSSR